MRSLSAEQGFVDIVQVQLGLRQPAWPKVVAVHFLQLLQLKTLVSFGVASK